MQVLIVGSGLSALAVQVALSEKFGDQIEITLIDANFRYRKDFEKLERSDAKKTYFGSDHMYSKIGYANNRKGELPLSYAAGGLSTVWGAGIRLWDRSLLEENFSNLDGFYRSAKALLSNIPYIGDNETLNLPRDFPIKSNSLREAPSVFKAIRSGSESLGVHTFVTPLAVVASGSRACTGCGFCLSGCPYGSIFTSTQYFDDLVLRSQIKRIQGKVETLSQVGNKVEVRYQNNNGEANLSVFDRVYVSAGALGTPIILMQSRLTPSKLQIKDSQVFYFIGLYKRPKKMSDLKFSLSQMTITDKTSYSASLYECNVDVRNRISSLIKDKCFGLKFPVPRFLDRYLFLGIGFLDSDHSGSIQVSRGHKDDIILEMQNNPKTAKYVRKASRSIKRRLRRDRLWVISRLTQIPSVGAGFHLGAGLPIGSELVTESGMLRNANKIYVADVSLLPKIFAGSHTFNSMSLNHQMIMRDFK
jgi:ferredoxin